MVSARDSFAACQIRLIGPGDAPALLRFYSNLSPLSKRNFHPMGMVATLEQCVAVCENSGCPDSDRYDLVGVASGQVVGWCFLWGLQNDKVSLGLGVADAWQRRGLGTALMREIMQCVRSLRLKAIHLTCVEDNLVAQHLYESFGFECGKQHVGEDGLRYVTMVARIAH